MTPESLRPSIEAWARSLQFDAIGISRIETTEAMAYLDQWLSRGFHGEMRYMERHRALRGDPSGLVEGALSVISVRMDYLSLSLDEAFTRLDVASLAAISVYALGKDYHKLIRRRLKQLAQKIESVIGPYGYRVFSDSAPILEKNYAALGGLGWIGKHTNLIDRRQGSFFFLGELVTDLPLPPDQPVSAHCGSCHACMTICPTQAIVAPYQLDARRCIAYLTIEYEGSISPEDRPLIGNRVYGCDDCQLVCPWNRYAQITREPDFLPRGGLEGADLVDLFLWTEAEFLRRLEGSAIRRIGHQRWLRNLAVGLGNAAFSPRIVDALRARLEDPSELVREHVSWALSRQLGGVEGSVLD